MFRLSFVFVNVFCLLVFPLCTWTIFILYSMVLNLRTPELLDSVLERGSRKTGMCQTWRLYIPSDHVYVCVFVYGNTFAQVFTYSSLIT